MNTRPTPVTPYELKLRLAEEERFYNTYGGNSPLAALDLSGLALHLADALQSASNAVRSIAANSGSKHAH